MKKILAVVLTVMLLAMGLGGSAVLAAPGTWEIAPDSPETPDVSVTDPDTITMGTPVGDTTQNMALHGATIEIPPCDEVYVEFDYDLYTWDSFNAVTSTPYSGYWDSFSVSVSQDKYWNLTLTDPVNTDADLDVGFIWGGTNFGDGILESTSGSGSATMAADNTSTNYLNVMLDTATSPQANHNHPSYGEITITKMEFIGLPSITKELVDAWEEVSDDDGIIEVDEKWYFKLEITVTNTSSVDVTDVMVKDNLGGDLELIEEYEASVGTLNSWTTGKTEKVHMTWDDIGTLVPGQTETLWLLVSTDINTGRGTANKPNGNGNNPKPGHQEYTSEGVHCLNSGATAKGFVELASGVWEVSDTTDEICVAVTGAKLELVEKDPSDWSTVPDGASGLLGYNLASDEFEFTFCASGLELGEDYSLIYYADFVDKFNVWGGNNPGALIATMTTDGSGDVWISGSVDLGIDLPSPPDANISTHDYSGAPDYYANAHGAKIWLVPSDCYDAVCKKVDTWSPTRFLFETDLIWYGDTDV